MLSIGITEILLVAAVALLVVGPERMPKVMRQLGRWYGQLRRSADELRRAFVLEADRQDAEERYDQLKDRRRRAVEARQRAKESAGSDTVVQEPELPAPAPTKGAELTDPDEYDTVIAPSPAAETPEPSA
jgi:sec-independent protein translocase protein TatB